MSSNNLRSALSEARGKGSAHEGAHHWLHQRITAIANIPLVLWFVYSIVCLVNQDHAAAGQFFNSPVNAALMSLLIISSFYHAALGLQIVVEDYVSSKAKRIVTLLVIKLGLFGLAATTILAIIKMHLGS